MDERRPPAPRRLRASCLPAAEAARRLRTALDPDGDWIAHVLRDADARAARRCAPATHPDAGGLVVAIDKEHAERLADRLARDRRRAARRSSPPTRRTPRARIARFAAGSGRWLVSVLMVSEGVDVPRLRVGVYATTARTELFFRQVVGRFIRRTPAPKRADEPPVPAVGPARSSGSRRRSRRSATTRSSQQAEGEAVAERGERAEARARPFRALWSSARRDDDVLQTTQPGDALQLFADAAPPPALAALAGVHRRVRRGREPRDARHETPRAPARRAPRAGRRRRAPHRRGAPRDPRARQPRDRRARRSPRRRVEQLERGNRAARAQTRLTSASWPTTTDSTPSPPSRSTTSR